MRTFLASIPLDGKTVVVVGSGEAAVAKARLAAKTPATLKWFAPFGPGPDALPFPGIEIENRLPGRADFEGAALAFIALSRSEEHTSELQSH